jgi:hypothetical protein
MTAGNFRSATAFLCGMLMLTSCSHLAEKRTLLATAGFKTVVVSGPVQLAQLQKMKTGKVLTLKGKNGQLYLFPEPATKSIMLGGPTQYKHYLTLRKRQKRIDEQVFEAQVNMDNADWNTWGDESMWGMAPASDP